MAGVLAGVAAMTVASSVVGVQATPDAVEPLTARARAEGRGLDQETNLAYQREQAAWADDENWVDPFRRSWSPQRGVEMPVGFENRYGAELYGILFRPALPWRDPVTGEDRTGPFPTVVVLPGLGNWANDYLGEAQQLAEHGYVVLAVEPQGQHLSKDLSTETDPEYCGDDGRWRRPQEAGLRETGPCAGQDPPEPTDEHDGSPLWPFLQPVRDTPLYLAGQWASWNVGFRTDPEPLIAGLARAYERFRTRFTFTAIDAADWLVSEENPWVALVDGARMGVAGHSAGADGAVVAGSASRRFRAAVAWDSYGLPPGEPFRPRVPTMWQQAEQQNLVGPWIPRPDPELWPSYDARRRFEERGVDTYLVALRGSTHQEWTWYPDAMRKLPPFLNASARGQQVATWYTLAWFDRYLKGHGSKAHAESGRQRLLAETFDDSVDRTNIGSGTYDPVTDSNVPYLIADEPVREHLSRLFRSTYAFDGRRCVDVVAGCDS